MQQEEKEEYKKGIKKTGYETEYKIGEILKENNWTIITNKYYLDDMTKAPREIDILGYKVKQIEDFKLYTTLLVSCKKDEKNNWAFFSKEKDVKNPNYDWNPLNYKTSSEIIEYMFNNEDCKNKYFTCFPNKLSKIKEHIFAFQLFNKASKNPQQNLKRPQDDGTIFRSISTLAKALGYETSKYINNTKNLKYQNRIDMYNLISIADTDLISAKFGKEDIKISEIKEVKYVFDYIVNHKEVCSKIHFIKYEEFSKLIKNYNELHKFNIIFMKELYKNFYLNIFNDYKKVLLFKEKFKKEFKSESRWIFFAHDNNYEQINKITSIDFSYKNQKEIKIEIDVSEEEDIENFIIDLNKNKEIKTLTKKLLSKFFKYKGNFEFVVYKLPF